MIIITVSYLLDLSLHVYSQENIFFHGGNFILREGKSITFLSSKTILIIFLVGTNFESVFTNKQIITFF